MGRKVYSRFHFVFVSLQRIMYGILLLLPNFLCYMFLSVKHLGALIVILKKTPDMPKKL